MLKNNSSLSLLLAAGIILSSACGTKADTPASQATPSKGQSASKPAVAWPGQGEVSQQPILDPDLKTVTSSGGTLFMIYYDPADPGAKAIKDSIEIFARRDMGPKTRIVATGRLATSAPALVRDGPPAWPVIYVIKGADSARVFSGPEAFQRSLSALYDTPLGKAGAR